MGWEERYDSVEESLQAVGAHVGAAESHGMLCGVLTGAQDTSQARWIADVLADTEPRGEAARACLEMLTILYDETAAGLADENFEFHPMLPGEHSSLPERSRALAAWCSGFLFGIGRSEPGSDSTLPANVREVLHDLSEIARVAAQPDDEEDDEESYAELVEYVRVAVLLCREHLLHTFIDDNNH
ncbi:YecA family protein [Halorhodospira halochloris]|uniref:Conserved exported protein n=1 Tax=Halorhodospira halochloris TaxID=1052 RepID=A0A0X8XB99_HALHR|nr:UPF0149 family protein [Halorhodospira halochloris]MCG5530232.1 YecA family protein [Halorhodospira halochloris]MCG5547146.1 YecA family protein [Halorhodospira halochloris]BAU56709.1 Putative conserved exported protein precursor [Halorhodospira halochloris]